MDMTTEVPNTTNGYSDSPLILVAVSLICTLAVLVLMAIFMAVLVTIQKCKMKRRERQERERMQSLFNIHMSRRSLDFDSVPFRIHDKPPPNITSMSLPSLPDSTPPVSPPHDAYPNHVYTLPTRGHGNRPRIPVFELVQNRSLEELQYANVTRV